MSVQAAANGDLIAVMFFALMFGIAATVIRSDGTRAFVAATQGVYDICLKLIDWVIRLAPIAVFALLFSLTAKVGFGALKQLALFVLVAAGAMAVHFFVVFPLLVRFAGGMSPLFFFRQAQPAILTAFSTSSSGATLPTTLRVAEENLGTPKRVGRFVCTLGATANMNGTALFEGITVLFLAQFFGVELSLLQQGLVLAMCILGGIGAAGVPGGSLPVIALILSAVGVPPEGIGQPDHALEPGLHLGRCLQFGVHPRRGAVEHLDRLAGGVQHEAGEHGRHRVQREPERADDAEVPIDTGKLVGFKTVGIGLVIPDVLFRTLDRFAVDLPRGAENDIIADPLCRDDFHRIGVEAAQRLRQIIGAIDFEDIVGFATLDLVNKQVLAVGRDLHSIHDIAQRPDIYGDCALRLRGSRHGGDKTKSGNADQGGGKRGFDEFHNQFFLGDRLLNRTGEANFRTPRDNAG